MSTSSDEQLQFKLIIRILAVPEEGKPPVPDKRKWIVPCLDDKAAADLPPKGDVGKWRLEWAACPPPPGPYVKADESSKALPKQGR